MKQIISLGQDKIVQKKPAQKKKILVFAAQTSPAYFKLSKAKL